MNPLETLQKYWGYATFRPLQREIIQAVLDGRDVLALLPTSGGKSICFQVPALIRTGLCIVVSPLVALMKDQVDRLKKIGVSAEAVFAGMTPNKIDLILDNCIYGHIKFLYVSPERLKTALLQERVKKMNVNLLAVDEAHCISQWGYDFRPAYLEIATFRALIANVNVIALTATATPTVQRDIQDKLQFCHPVRFQQSFARDNLVYVVRKTENKEGQLLKILRHVPGTAIVYVSTRKKTKVIAQFLRKNGIDAVAYHAGLTTLEREVQQEAWVGGAMRVMVATNAFGMGIDKANVRSIIHLDLPATLEAYYQEAGRAGRDERRAYAVILHDHQDITLLLKSIQVAYPPLDQLRKVYQHLANYYQIAVGSHPTTTYDFDLEHFAHACNLDPRIAYQSLKTLEGEGLIQLNETFSQPAQLQISTDPYTFYAFQEAHASYGPLLKALLRLYGGELFATSGDISVQRITHFLDVTPQKVERQLQALDNLALIRYCPQKSTPQLTFTTPRYATASLPLASRRLKQRTAIAQEKAEAVIHYITQQHRCRAQLLLEYFGEETYQQCKRCDVCLTRRQEEGLLSTEKYQDFRGMILQRLQTGMRELTQIVDNVDFATEKAVLATIRQMLDDGELAYDSTSRLVQPPHLRTGKGNRRHKSEIGGHSDTDVVNTVAL
ncbi:MAG: RecQ family ATP-dependent DNA helicase [Amoebophilaceae bacterium]|nr:RecQ family ATP-dependent DNA helicase [Amoebophilaceae bacterium]